MILLESAACHKKSPAKSQTFFNTFSAEWLD